MPRHYTVEQGKMAAQNEQNFALFTSSDLEFLTDDLFTEMDLLTEQTETSETERNGQQLDDQDVDNFIVENRNKKTRKWRIGEK